MSIFKDVEEIKALNKTLQQEEILLINMQNDILIARKNKVKFVKELNDLTNKIGARRFKKILTEIGSNQSLKEEEKKNPLLISLLMKQKSICKEEIRISNLNDSIGALESKIRYLKYQIDFINNKPEYEPEREYDEKYYIETY